VAGVSVVGLLRVAPPGRGFGKTVRSTQGFDEKRGEATDLEPAIDFRHRWHPVKVNRDFGLQCMLLSAICDRAEPAETSVKVCAIYWPTIVAVRLRDAGKVAQCDTPGGNGLPAEIRFNKEVGRPLNTPHFPWRSRGSESLIATRALCFQPFSKTGGNGYPP